MAVEPISLIVGHAERSEASLAWRREILRLQSALPQDDNGQAFN